ncbi:MAG: alpha-mannosidase [Ruminococcaceae bacterium]|nr:alpha-mannosidase [Oscillospiraceae bacterium]
MTFAEKFHAVYAHYGKSYWASRIAAQLLYAVKLSETEGSRYEREIGHVLDALLASIEADGVITDAAAQFAEKLLAPLSEAAKKYTMLCVGHAHIDMNWMWGFQETAAVTVDTFRTMLDLMREYPEFTFAQSQASVYKIIEDYAPWMLDEIRQRIAEGRWEVTASTWVEPDKNMPSGESLARHILNTKRYLSELLQIDADSLNIDFEPDTFGHSANLPEICAAGGVKYYYHCRGEVEHTIYRWRSESGAELLVFREPTWYNDTIEPNMVDLVPEFCTTYGVDCVLQVYGVGDHGGGPTRRDIERAIDMMSWPVMPTIRFGTFGEFFRAIDRPENNYPVLVGEQNFLFTGCYTSQSRIKMANRIGEDRLYESEMLATMAHAAGGLNLSKSFAGAWEHVLFNHFHDILPGSGMIETREYALAGFQQSLAAATTNANYAMRTIAEQIDLSSLSVDDDRLSVSEGGGVGYTTDEAAHFALPKADRGRGKTRVFTLFNTTMYPWRGPVEITIWDWPGDVGRLAARKAGGDRTVSQVLEQGKHYWGHRYTKVAVDAEISALGYATYVVEETEPKITMGFKDLRLTRVDDFNDGPLTLENDCIRAVFERSSMRCVSLTDLATGKELLDRPSASFRIVDEDTVNGMTSWRVGNAMQITDINTTNPVRVENVATGGLVQSITYAVAYRSSTLKVTVRLAAHSPVLEFDVTADFHEIGSQDTTPQLAFAVPIGYSAAKFINDIPMGITERGPLAHDVPCRTFTMAKNEGKHDQLLPSVMLVSDSKYGFRNQPDELTVTLLRASTDPDPYPEFGIHHFRLGIAAVSAPSYDVCSRISAHFAHPCAAVSVPTGRPQPELALPLTGALCRVEGDGVCLSAVKPAEDGAGTVLRVYNTLPTETDCRIAFRVKPKGAYACDLTERHKTPMMFNGKILEFKLPPRGVQTIRLLPTNADL